MPEKAYLLWWDNGDEYDAHRVELLGVYSSEERRRAARVRFDQLTCWPFGTRRDDSEYLEDFAILDLDFYPVKDVYKENFVVEND